MIALTGLQGARMKLRVLIADDESLSRERLRRFLREEPHVEIVAECVDGKETVAAIRQIHPNLIFLDVQMPELDGFGVLHELGENTRPAIVFVTAYDRFALRAFELHAVDYLLKPFDRERFSLALARVRERLGDTAGDAGASALSGILATLEARHRPPLERLTVKLGDRITLVDVAKIDWISAADNYVELHVGPATHLVRTTLRTLAQQLASDRFVRISRSLLVNSERIKEIRPKPNGDYLVVLQNGKPLAGTRNHRQNLARLLGKDG